MLLLPRLIAFVLLVFVIGPTAIAQRKSKEILPPSAEGDRCIYRRKYSDSARLALYPFDVPRIELVSFRYHRGESPIQGDTAIITDSLVERVILSRSDVLALSDLLLHYNQTGSIYAIGNCWMPRNAILFYDDKGKLQDFAVFCFHCENMHQSSDRLVFGKFCSEKWKRLSAFFKARGIALGTDADRERYDGEKRSVGAPIPPVSKEGN